MQRVGIEGAEPGEARVMVGTGQLRETRVKHSKAFLQITLFGEQRPLEASCPQKPDIKAVSGCVVDYQVQPVLGLGEVTLFKRPDAHQFASVQQSDRTRSFKSGSATLSSSLRLL